MMRVDSTSEGMGRMSSVAVTLRRVTAFVLVFAGLFTIAQVSLGSIQGNPRFLVDTSRLQKIELPSWAPPVWHQEVKQLSKFGKIHSILTTDVVDLTARNVNALSFVEKVDRVEKVFPRAVETKVTVRRPVLLVEHGAVVIPVDEHGIVLSANGTKENGGFTAEIPFLKADASQLLAPRPGVVWKDPLILESIGMAREAQSLANKIPGLKISVIDATNWKGWMDPTASEFTLFTPNGCSIQWGRPAIRNSFGELSTAMKIDHVVRVLRKFPGGRGVKAMDVRFDKPTAWVVSAGQRQGG